MSDIKQTLPYQNAIKRAKEKKIVLPTFAEMRDPSLIPNKIKEALKTISLWDPHPLNLFRISWKNEPIANGGGYGEVNTLEIPSSLSGVKARIIMMVGKWFPTGAHKVGAAYGCLVPKILAGEFDPVNQKAVWPSTGNYCRGGAFDSHLLGCDAVAILPEEMSAERFAWLEKIGAEIIKTPGSESNVKEIYDKCWDIKKNRPDCTIFNQFEEWGNACWHFGVTGPSIGEAYEKLNKGEELAAFISSTGSAGTISAGDYLKTKYPKVKITACEAAECPTLLENGFGAHRIEGIGDKHVPWIHNVRNTDVVAAIKDQLCIDLMRLFNEKEGQSYLLKQGVPEETISRLHLLGISGIGNLLGAIKTAKYYELSEQDVIFSVATDSMELYSSRLQEEQELQGDFGLEESIAAFNGIKNVSTSELKELTYADRRARHNLKYFTWVEQQERSLSDLNQLWEDRKFFQNTFSQIEKWDQQIKDFNQESGVLESL